MSNSSASLTSKWSRPEGDLVLRYSRLSLVAGVTFSCTLRAGLRPTKVAATVTLACRATVQRHHGRQVTI